MLTSWSLQFTPAALSMASVWTSPPATAYSMRPSWVSPRFPPSTTIRHRSSLPFTRTPSLARSPTSALVSVARLDVRADPPVPEQVDGSPQHRRDELVGGEPPGGRIEHGPGGGTQLDRLLEARVDPTAGRDQGRVVVGPARAGQIEQSLALGERHLGVGVGVDEHVAMVERGHEPQRLGAQHAVAEHVARHVPDAHDRERIGVGVLAEHAGVAPRALPRSARRDPHRLVVVPGAAAGGEGVAQPVAVLDGDVVGDVAERGRALVGGDDEVRVVLVVDHGVGRVDDGGTVGPGHQVVGEIEQAADEGLIAQDDLRPQRLGLGRRTLDDEAALGSRRHDDGVLHHLRLHQPEDLGAEVLPPVAPAQAAPGDRTPAEVDPFDPRPADPHLVARPRRRQLGDLGRVELERDGGPAAVVVRPDRRLDERLERPADAVLVEARDRVERRRRACVLSSSTCSSRSVTAGSKRAWNRATRSATRRGWALSVSSTYVWLKPKPICRRYLAYARTIVTSRR